MTKIFAYAIRDDEKPFLEEWKNFRSIAKGRENWLQCGSHDAARHTAFMYSLVESCRMNDLDFGHYIETVLIRIQDGDTDFHGMLPNVIVLPETAGNASIA